MSGKLVRSPIPLYYRISQLLKEKIQSGEIPSGGKLPRESELSRQHGVSSITVRAAMRVLIHDGLIARYPGKGTFVTNRKQIDQVIGLGSINDLIVPVKQSEMSLLWWRVISADQLLADKLSVVPGSRIHTIRNIRRVHGEPFLLSDVFFPPEISKSLTELDFTIPEARTKMVMEIVEERCAVKVTDIRQTMSVDFADRAIAKILDVKRGTPLLIAEREFFEGGRIVQFSRGRYRTDHHRFVVNLSRVEKARREGGWT